MKLPEQSPHALWAHAAQNVCVAGLVTLVQINMGAAWPTDVTMYVYLTCVGGSALLGVLGKKPGVASAAVTMLAASAPWLAKIGALVGLGRHV